MIVLLVLADLEAGDGSAEPADGVPLEGPRLYFADVGGNTVSANCCSDNPTSKPLAGQPIRSPLSLNDGSGNRARIVWLPQGPTKEPSAATIQDLQRSDISRSSGSGGSSSGSSTEEGTESSIRTQEEPGSQTAVAMHRELATAAHLGTAAAQPATAQDTAAISDAATNFADAVPAASSRNFSHCASGEIGSAGSPSRRRAAASQALWVESRISAARFVRSHTSSPCLGSGGTAGAHAAGALATEHSTAAEAADDSVAVSQPLAVHSQEAATITVVGWPLEGQEAIADPQFLLQEQWDHRQQLQ